jgi:hypothetical protein
MWSEECQDCAAGEGWGHFVAADLFNSHGQSDCFMWYWFGTGVSVDCEDYDQTANAEAFHRNVCGGGSGRGVELDWFRQFWDIHGSGGANMAQLKNWFLDAGDWQPGTAYSILDAAAQQQGATLRNRWNAAAGWIPGNGYDQDDQNGINTGSAQCP